MWCIKTIFFEVMYAVIARVLFSSCWDILWCIKTNLVWRCQMQWLQEYSFSSCLDILWCIKTNFLLKYCMQWLQEYCFLDVATLCDASRQIFFSSIVCSICKSTISFILWCIKTHFVLKFMNAVILQDYCFLLDVTLCDVWWFKTNFLLKYCMQRLQEYCFPHVVTFSDESKRI